MYKPISGQLHSMNDNFAHWITAVQNPNEAATTSGWVGWMQSNRNNLMAKMGQLEEYITCTPLEKLT